MDNRASGNGTPFSVLPWFGGFGLLLAYLYVGTGIHSDDYSNIFVAQGLAPAEILTLYRQSPTYLYYLPTLYFDFLQFAAYGFEAVYYEVAKIVISLFAAVATWLFAKQYVEPRRAFLLSALFVLYPLHDSTNYWFTGTYMMVTGAWVMLAHVYLNRGHIKTGLTLGTLGAFWSYASPPLVGGLSITFLMKREYRKFALFVLPEALYVSYYFVVSRMFDTGSFRSKDISAPLNVAKQLLLQVATFLDVAIGPSFWLKIYYAVSSIGVLSLLIGAVIAVSAWRLCDGGQRGDNRMLFIVFAAVALCGFFVYAVTGMFPQIAFNLGNRVTYFGCLLLALFTISMPVPRWISAPFIAIICFAVVGLADHWKSWNAQQNKILTAIRTNPELAAYSGDALYVTGHQYSRLGPMSHVEFLSETYMVNMVFRTAMGKQTTFKTRTLNRRYRLEGNRLVDRKYGDSFEVGNDIVVYDSEKNKILRIGAMDINTYIEALPVENRHWLQLIGDGPARNLALLLMPRLQYVFM